MNEGKLWLLLTVLMTLTGCTHVEEYDSSEDSELSEVFFNGYLSHAKDVDTRATYPVGGEGGMTTAKLKSSGFGVFASYTGASTYDYAGSGIGDVAHNFMWNQQVEWAGGKWTYSPVKYWPNDNQPADQQVPPAQGSEAHSYVSFFAYAPYQQVADPAAGLDVTATPAHSGIVKVDANSAASGNATLTYRTSGTSPFSPTGNVDLLWANQQNLWKMKSSGEGYVDGYVHFLFKHALSKFTVYVQGLFDHRDNDDTSMNYPDDVDGNTRILIERVDFSNSPLMSKGRMYLAARPNDATVPCWDLLAADSLHIDINGFTLNEDLRDAYIDGTQKAYHTDWLVDTDAATAKDNFLALPTGVTHTEQPLFDDTDEFLMVIPNKDYITAHPADVMKVHIVYYVITYDPNLTLNNPKYYSIVKNDILATFSSSFSFEPNKQYKLVLMPGLTTVKFQLSVADEWETPIVMDPVVIDWFVSKKEYNVN